MIGSRASTDVASALAALARTAGSLAAGAPIEQALAELVRAAAQGTGADVAVLTGDLTNFGDPPDAFQVVDAVRAHCPTVWAVTGNLDMAWVIDAFREAGISPAKILRTMTTNAAVLLGIEKERGALRPGMKADLVAADGNPLDDIGGLKHVRFVMKEGKIVKR